MPPGPDPEPTPETTGSQPPPAPPPQQRRPPPPGRPPHRPPPPRRPLPPKPRQPRRHHHRGKAGRARIGLAVMFFAFCVIHFLWFDATPPEYHRASYASIINSTIWNTALLLAIARRKSWARLIMLTILGLGIAGGLAVTPMLFEIPAFLTIHLITLGILAISFAWLLYSRDIRRLVGRDYE